MEASGKGKAMVKVLKILGRTLLAIVIVLSALLFCAVKFLESKQLSPMVERVANDYIEGEVKLGSLKIGFHPRFPTLGVEIKDLSIISNAFDSLTPEQRGVLPVYADSLLKLDYMSGSFNIKRLLMNKELVLHDVILRGLSVNLVIARDGKANYEVVKAPDDTVRSNKDKKLQGFRIDRFALEQPKEIRFYNAADSTSASVVLLTDASVDGKEMPTYRLKLTGNVSSPKATLITNLDQISFGLNGKVYWNPDRPELVALEEMELRGAFIKALVTGEVDLKDDPIIRKAVVELSPVALADLLTLVPDSIRRVHRLYEPYFLSNVAIGGKFELMEPMDLTTDTFPAARINLTIPSSTLRYGKSRFEELALDATVNTFTNLPDSTVIDIKRCIVTGDATRLKASALISTLFTDPAFDTKAEGDIDLRNLPPMIREKIPGYLSGILSTELHLKGKASMFKQKLLHRLIAEGSVTGRKIYFLTPDTNNMVEVNKVRIDFNSKRIVNGTPLLSAAVDVDTANLLLGGVDLAFGDISLNVGTENTGAETDTTFTMPVGGDLKVSRFNIISITDSAGARIRKLDGHVTLRSLNKQKYVPQLLADLHTGRVSAGSLSDRILLDDTKINATLEKLPSVSKKRSGARNAARKRREYSYIAPATVFKHAYAKRHRKPGEKRKRRVYGTLSADDNEILEWNLAKGFNKFLNEWTLTGSLSTNQARLLTPVFPLHNRFSRLDVKFNNDTVDISNISLRTGKSDITLSGLVTNVKRALTSKTDNTLKVNFSLMSDTIDINELSAGAFTGAAYAEHKRHGKKHFVEAEDDAALEAQLDELAKKGAGNVAPFLIPVNVEANLRIAANNMLYSDLAMQNMGGDLLVYDGGVNLHDMKAYSDAGNLSLSALYSAPKPENIQFGFGMKVDDFNIAKFVKLVPAIDSITPLMHDFAGTVNADIAATCRIDSGMNLDLPTLNAAIRITGDNLAFIDPQKYRTLGKWLGFKNKADNTIKRMNVEMTVADGLMRVYPFVLNIDRYRLGVSGFNDIAMNFDYHISVLKSPLPFKFGITISGNPKKYKVRFGGAKFKEDTAVESVSVVNNARINLIDQIENVFRRGVQNSSLAKLQIALPDTYDKRPDPGLSATDSLQLIKEGLMDPTATARNSKSNSVKASAAKNRHKKKHDEKAEEKPGKKRKKFIFF